MKYYLGIDGGGTKTAYLLTDERDTEVMSFTQSGCSYRELGIDGVVRQISQGMSQLLAAAELSPEVVSGIGLGLPCYGESRENDCLLEQEFARLFAGKKYVLANDVKVGWAGSLGLKPGINIVAGTGSIAYGENAKGESARSGGWSTFFGDEGSCYWLGRRTMELFFKEMDYREPRGSLYSVVMEHFGLTDPVDAIDLWEREYVPCRDQVAALQKLLLRAAEDGDGAAIRLYEEAVKELYLIIRSTASALQLGGESFAVSYSGGLFHAEPFVLPQLKEYVSGLGGYLKKPMFSPVQGAVLLAKKAERA